MDVMYELNGNLFVWDEQKAKKNLHKHGIRFEEAATVFGDPMLRLVDASRGGESRDAVIGFDSMGVRMLYVIHIESCDLLIRIISARRATTKEILLYVD